MNNLAPQIRSHIADAVDDAQNPATPAVVFVTGASRSGTTLMSRMLGRHSKIGSTNELHFFGDLVGSPLDVISEQSHQMDIVATLDSRQRNGLWRTIRDQQSIENASALLQTSGTGHPSLDHPTGAELFFRWASKFLDTSEKQLLCEHTPRNVFFAGALLESNPNARVIHIVRDPRAVLASQKFRSRRGKLDSVRIPLRERLRVAASFHPIITSRLWNKATSSALTHQSHPRVLIVKYEDLILDGKSAVTEILEFLGVEYESQVLDVDVTGSSHQTTDNSDKGLSTKSLNRWKSVLTLPEIRMCERVSDAHMKTFGYATASGGNSSWLSRALLIGKLPLKIVLVAAVDPGRVRIQLRSMIKPKGR